MHTKFVGRRSQPTNRGKLIVQTKTQMNDRHMSAKEMDSTSKNNNKTKKKKKDRMEWEK